MLFPNVVARQRYNYKIGHMETLFNVQWRKLDLNPINPMTYPLPDAWTVQERHPHLLSAHIFSDAIVNNFHVVKKVCITNGKWFITILEKSISPAFVGLCDFNDWSGTCVQSIFYLVEALKVCIGKEIPPLHICNSESTTSDIHLINTCNEIPISRARSLKCTYVLPLTMFSRTCKACQQLKFHSNSGEGIIEGEANNGAPATTGTIASDENHTANVTELLDVLAEKDLPDTANTLTSQVRFNTSSNTRGRFSQFTPEIPN